MPVCLLSILWPPVQFQAKMDTNWDVHTNKHAIVLLPEHLHLHWNGQSCDHIQSANIMFTLLEVWGGGIQCPDRRKSEEKAIENVDQSSWMLSTFLLLIKLSICKRNFSKSTPLDMAAILSLEIVTFSYKVKSVFQLCWKNTSSHNKNYKTKNFCLIKLHMEWSKIFHLRL